MDWTRFLQWDPELLYGIVNTELRNHREDLEELCAYHGIERSELEQHMAKCGYRYEPEINQFR